MSDAARPSTREAVRDDALARRERAEVDRASAEARAARLGTLRVVTFALAVAAGLLVPAPWTLPAVFLALAGFAALIVASGRVGAAERAAAARMLHADHVLARVAGEVPEGAFDATPLLQAAWRETAQALHVAGPRGLLARLGRPRTHRGAQELVALAMTSPTAEERSEDSIDMARIVFGRDFVDENCVILGNVNVNSPLVWDGTMTKSLRAYARANQAAVIVPFILGGAMGPVTNAGAIAQSLAETMAGCALTQLERKGAPVIFGNFLSSMSLRSGSPTFGTPEPAIGSMVIGQLARRLNLPLRCSGNFTTSKLPDAQAMTEGAMSMLAAVHCGANFVLHSAGFLDGLLSMSYEKFMLDSDLCGALHTYLDGIKVDDNELAVDAFAEVGPGNHFFGCSHTLANYETAYWDSETADNTPFEQWELAGSDDAATRANRLWKQRLREYEAPGLDQGIDEALQDFMTRKKASMADAWY